MSCSDDQIKYLKTFLADILSAKHGLYGVHWHVKGRGFLEIHKFTEEVYTFLIERYDAIAERLVSLGYNIPPCPVTQLEMTTFKWVDFSFINVRDGWQLTKFYLRQLSRSVHCAKMACGQVRDETSSAILDEDIVNVDKFLWLAKHSCPCNELPSVVESKVNELYEDMKKEMKENCQKHDDCCQNGTSNCACENK